MSGESNKPGGAGGRAGRAGRGLGEVLHYFIAEDEQAEARSRAGHGATVTAPSVAPWLFAAQPDRPLGAALALDLAHALAGPGVSPQILATFAPHPLLPPTARELWRVVTIGPGHSLGAILARAADDPGGTAALLALTTDALTELLPTLSPGTVSGVILPVDTSSRGLAQALALLRALPRPGHWLRIGVLFVGSGRGAPPEGLFRKLYGAARRQLGIGLEQLGSLERAAADFRSLLTGISIFDADPEAPSARALLRVCQRLETRSGDDRA